MKKNRLLFCFSLIFGCVQAAEDGSLPPLLLFTLDDFSEEVAPILQCLHCEETFTENNALETHSLTHEPQRTLKQVYSCTLCSRKPFDCLPNLKRHIRIHTGEKPFECTQCDKKFTNSSNLKTHAKKYHPIQASEEPADETFFQCEHCPKTFTRKDHFFNHTSTHTGERPFQCEHCPKTFIRKDHLFKHASTHTDEKPFECSHCDKTFALKEYLFKHMQRHTNEKPFECSHCDKTFALKENFRRHLRSNHSTVSEAQKE